MDSHEGMVKAWARTFRFGLSGGTSDRSALSQSSMSARGVSYLYRSSFFFLTTGKNETPSDPQALTLALSKEKEAPRASAFRTLWPFNCTNANSYTDGMDSFTEDSINIEPRIHSSKLKEMESGFPLAISIGLLYRN